MNTASNSPRLTVSHLSTSFPTEDGLVRSVADVSFSIQPGKTTALVSDPSPTTPHGAIVELRRPHAA